MDNINYRNGHAETNNPGCGDCAFPAGAHQLQRHPSLHAPHQQLLLPPYAPPHSECPWLPPTYYFADASTLTCVSTCPAPSFGFTGNQTCLTTCPSSPNATFYDHTNRRCVTQCPANFYASSNQSCLAGTSSLTQPVLPAATETNLCGLA